MNPQMMAQMEAMMGGGAQPTATATADARPPSEKYASELAQIKEMGFNDDELILQMLVQTNGNVNLALERLFTSL
jgi:ubiquilin